MANAGFGIENEMKAKEWVVKNIKIENNYNNNRGFLVKTHYGYFKNYLNNPNKLMKVLIDGAQIYGLNKDNKTDRFNVYGYGNYEK